MNGGIRIRGPYKRYLREPNPFESQPKSTRLEEAAAVRRRLAKEVDEGTGHDQELEEELDLDEHELGNSKREELDLGNGDREKEKGLDNEEREQNLEGGDREEDLESGDREREEDLEGGDREREDLESGDREREEDLEGGDRKREENWESGDEHKEEQDLEGGDGEREEQDLESGDGEEEEGLESEEDYEEQESENQEVGNGQEDIYEGADLTVQESLLLILSFVTRHKLSGQALNDLLALINLHCPKPNLCKKSLYQFKSFFSSLSTPVETHYYCSRCFNYIGPNQGSTCTSCEHPVNEDYYFTVLPLEKQLESLFGRKGFYDHLQYRFSRTQSNNIKDIYDGQQYQRLSQSGVLSKSSTISFKINTDGVCVFNSSNKDIWPVFLQINELPPVLRRQMKNLLLGGLWFGEGHPPMNTFLRPIAETLRKLEKGITVCLHNGSTIHVNAVLLSAVNDIPAKNDVLGMVNHNSKYGCSHCLQPGTVVRTARGGNVRVYSYCEDSETGHGPPRTHHRMCEDAKSCIQDAEMKPVYGMKDVCLLSGLQHFDMEKGVSVDPMHGIYLGVARLLLGLWLDSCHHKERWYCGTKVTQIDERLTTIRPPHHVNRGPRSLQQRKNWKATEYHWWLLYYLLPCMEGILPPDYLDHSSRLVEAVYLLNKHSITPHDLQKGQSLLKQFYQNFDVLYTTRYLTLNTHQLLHYAECVKQLGPLWANSCFEFESANGHLKQLFHGTRKIDMQITSAVGALQYMHEVAGNIQDGPTQELYSRMTGEHIIQCKTEIEPGIYTIGVPRHALPMPAADKEALSKFLGMEPQEEEITIYLRAYNTQLGMVSSELHQNGTKKNSYSVQYNIPSTNYYGQVKYFVCYRTTRATNLLAVIKKLQIIGILRASHMLRVHPRNQDTEVVPVRNITNHCIYMEFNSNIIIAPLANPNRPE